MNGRRATAPPIPFIYIGGSTLTVVGGATGRAYRFAHSGCRLDIDARDVPGIAGIPMLLPASNDKRTR